MKPKPIQHHGVWQQDRVNYAIKMSLKRKFRKQISIRKISKVWEDYMQEEIIKPLSIGIPVKIDKFSSIWVKATPITEHKRAMALFKKGLMYKNRRIVPVNLNFDTSKYIYSIVYENNCAKKERKLFFKPNAKISKAVSEGIKAGKVLIRFEN